MSCLNSPKILTTVLRYKQILAFWHTNTYCSMSLHTLLHSLFYTSDRITNIERSSQNSYITPVMVLSAWWEKMGNLGSSFPGNIYMWKEILEFGGKFFLFEHKNTIRIGENWACFPGNKHFFILWLSAMELQLGVFGVLPTGHVETHTNKMHPGSLRTMQHFTHIYLHTQDCNTYPPDKSWLFWSWEKTWIPN